MKDVATEFAGSKASVRQKIELLLCLHQLAAKLSVLSVELRDSN
jgi:hypothetical protein